MRLIDADALIRECEEELKDESLWHDEDTTKDYAEGNDDGKRIIMTIIDSAPTIEPKRGEWKNYKDEHYCSNCGEVVIDDWYDTDDWYNFCPNCGAKMGEREGE